MAPALPSRARKSGDNRRRGIADAALRVVAAHGLGRFTASALAAEVGVTDGALFRHFPTKEAIVLAAIGRVEELFLPSLLVDAANPLERLGAFFRHRVEAIRSRPGISRLVISEELAHAAPPEGVARVAALRRRSAELVRACLDEAARAGLLAPGLRADDAAVVVLGTILALGHAATPGDPGRLWSTLETFLRGRTAHGAGRRPPPTSRRPPRRTP